MTSSKASATPHNGLLFQQGQPIVQDELREALSPPTQSATATAKELGGSLLKIIKSTDTHLRVLEDRISGAEEHRAVLYRRLQKATTESDLETTSEAYRRSTSELLSMYREHKTKVI